MGSAGLGAGLGAGLAAGAFLAASSALARKGLISLPGRITGVAEIAARPEEALMVASFF